jgi:orotate phosphoribosyltransferase
MHATDQLLERLDPVVREVLAESGALLSGHFALTSGKHSLFYFQATRLLQHPRMASMAAAAAAAHFEKLRVDATLAPAVGGIVWGFALAQRFPGCRALFAERVDGRLTIRRGFAIEPGWSILLAEDVITTGGTAEDLRALAAESGAEVVGLAALADRSGRSYDPGVELFSWAEVTIPLWEPADCPLCLEGSTAVKPGSRGLS